MFSVLRIYLNLKTRQNLIVAFLNAVLKFNLTVRLDFF